MYRGKAKFESVKTEIESYFMQIHLPEFEAVATLLNTGKDSVLRLRHFYSGRSIMENKGLFLLWKYSKVVSVQGRQTDGHCI
jgi:hypothetical protein